jgi:Domain of unknown function (DUF4261)
MASPARAPSPATARVPQFSAVVVCGRYTEIKLTQLIAALRTIAPASVIGDWAGPFKTPPTDALGTDMLSVDGISLTLLNVNVPLPAAFFDPGPIPNQLMPDAAARLRNHQAHVLVMPAAKPVGRAAAIAAARAVTLLTWAVAVVAQAEAVKWADANNVVPVGLLQAYADKLLPAGGMAVPVWTRILAGRAHGQQKIMAGSYGLWAFGLPEIEYAPTDLPIQYLIPHAYMVCDMLLRSNRPVNNNETIDVDGENAFQVETLKQGFFVQGPALRLGWLRANTLRRSNG